MSNLYKYEEPKAYQKTMGSYKTHFRGKPDDYWETSYFDFFSAIAAMLLLIGFFVGLSVLIVNWSFYWGTQSYAITMSIVTGVFLIIALILNFLMSKGKRKEQKRIMRQAIMRFREKCTENKKTILKKDDENVQSRFLLNETQHNLHSTHKIKE